MSAFQIIVAAMLKRAAKRASTDPAAALLNGDGGAGMFRAVFKALSGRSGPDPKGPPFFLIKASQALLSAVVLRAPPLSGERVRAKLRTAESELARAARKSDDPAAVAFLAARDGREDALETGELRGDGAGRSLRPPPALPCAHRLPVRRPAGGVRQVARHLRPRRRWIVADEQQAALITLTDELVVALALGGSLRAFDGARYPVEVGKVVGAAASRVDVALVSALRLQDKKKMSIVERLEISAPCCTLGWGRCSRGLRANDDNGNGSSTDWDRRRLHQ
ncbi:unnamed protein product [Urochloa humidicola]